MTIGTDPTPLDTAHAAMDAAPDDEVARLRFYDRLALCELFLLLESEAEGDNIRPRMFDLETGPVVLAFDREDRLAAFAEGQVPYAALPGRVLAEMLAGQGLGLGLNLDVAPSAILLPAQAVDWLHDRLQNRPTEAQARPQDLSPPHGVPETLLPALEDRLAGAAGLADLAYMATATYDGGAQSHLLAFVDAVPGAEPALARAVQAALDFSGIEAGAVDVVFLTSREAAVATLARVGLKIELPRSDAPASGPSAPGMNPDAPPILR